MLLVVGILALCTNAEIILIIKFMQLNVQK